MESRKQLRMENSRRRQEGIKEWEMIESRFVTREGIEEWEMTEREGIEEWPSRRSDKPVTEPMILSSEMLSGEEYVTRYHQLPEDQGEELPEMQNRRIQGTPIQEGFSASIGGNPEIKAKAGASNGSDEANYRNHKVNLADGAFYGLDMAADIDMVDSNFEIGKAVSGIGIQTRVSVPEGRSTERDLLGENVSLEVSSLGAHPINVCTCEEGWLIPPEPTKVDLRPLSKFGDPVGPELYKTRGSFGRKPNLENFPRCPKYLSPSDPNYEPDPIGNTLISSIPSCKRGDTLKAPAMAHSWKRRARELKESPKQSPTPFTKEKKK
ncbi:hypothetical protein U1Q18_005899 [Sarracenia purpurea var. burkii]